MWLKHPGLVWSNPEAADDVRIRAALLHPRFTCLLDIAVAFGLDRVKAQWAYLVQEPTPECDRARPIVERILRNIEKGITLAAA